MKRNELIIADGANENYNCALNYIKVKYCLGVCEIKMNCYLQRLPSLHLHFLEQRIRHRSDAGASAGVGTDESGATNKHQRDLVSAQEYSI